MEVSQLDEVETAFLEAYKKNGYKATQAYLAVRPDCSRTHASTMGVKILNRPHVMEVLDSMKKAMAVKIDKNDLIVRTGTLIDKAEDLKQIGAAIRGVELQGRFIGAFENDEGDADKYVQFLTKISAKNVTVVNNMTEDNRKVILNEEVQSG